AHPAERQALARHRLVHDADELPLSVADAQPAARRRFELDLLAEHTGQLVPDRPRVGRELYMALDESFGFGLCVEVGFRLVATHGLHHMRWAPCAPKPMVASALVPTGTEDVFLELKCNHAVAPGDTARSRRPAVHDAGAPAGHAQRSG